MQRQLNVALSDSLLVLIAIIIKDLGSTQVICQNTTAFFSGFERESDSTYAKQQMELVRYGKTHCHG